MSTGSIGTFQRQPAVSEPVPAYLPMMVLLAFAAFLLTGFGAGLGALQPVPVYVLLCLALLTIQEHIAENRSLAHRVYVFLASSFAVIYAGELVFAARPLDFTHEPVTYVLAEAVLLVVFLGDTVARYRRRAQPATASARFGALAIDAAAMAVFFYVSAFLLDLLGGQALLRHFGLHIGEPYVVVNLNTLFHLHLSSPANTLEGLNLVLALAASALALGLLTMAGVVLPSTEQEVAHADGLRSFWQVLRDGARQVTASLRLVIGPLIWLIPAFSVAFFADHVSQYFNAGARQHSSIFDLFNPLSEASRANIALGITTLLLGLAAVVALIVAVAVLETNTSIIAHTLVTLRDAARSIMLTWALFMYSLAAINAVAILLGATKATPFQVGAPGLLALLIGIAVLAYESAQVARPPASAPTIRTAPPRPLGQPLGSRLERTGPIVAPRFEPRRSSPSGASSERTPAGLNT
jgi:hypothetical protein